MSDTRIYVGWFTCQPRCQAHVITDEQIGRIWASPHGQIHAVCDEQVMLAPSTAPWRSLCPHCQAWLQSYQPLTVGRVRSRLRRWRRS